MISFPLEDPVAYLTAFTFVSSVRIIMRSSLSDPFRTSAPENIHARGWCVARTASMRPPME